MLKKDKLYLIRPGIKTPKGIRPWLAIGQIVAFTSSPTREVYFFIQGFSRKKGELVLDQELYARLPLDRFGNVFTESPDLEGENKWFAVTLERFRQGHSLNSSYPVPDANDYPSYSKMPLYE
jgi:hypothetical protein